MSGNTDSKTNRQNDERYAEYKQMFYDIEKYLQGTETASQVESIWLWNMADMQYDPIDRAMAIMPLALYEAKRGILSEEMLGELLGTQDDINQGLLNSLPDDELDEIKKDILLCLEKTNL